MLGKENLLVLVKDNVDYGMFDDIDRTDWLYVINVIINPSVLENIKLKATSQFDFALEGLRNYADELGISFNEEKGRVVFEGNEYRIHFAGRTIAESDSGEFTLEPMTGDNVLIGSSEKELVEFHVEDVKLSYDIVMYDNWNGVISMDVPQELLEKTGLTKEEIQEDFAKYLEERLKDEDGE